MYFYDTHHIYGVLAYYLGHCLTVSQTEVIKSLC